MDARFVWIIVACLFGGAEMLTMGLFLAPFALAAAAAALLSAPARLPRVGAAEDREGAAERI
jgi:membrane protein implicated in regulation of membrane protease activity